MKKFKIKANIFLNRDVQGYYHSIYEGMYSNNFAHPIHINYLKNDLLKYSDDFLKQASQKLLENLDEDLFKIFRYEMKDLYICVVPRAKPENFYEPSQLLFKETIRTFVDTFPASFFFYNGLDFIKRIEETCTTHLRKISVTYKGKQSDKGKSPYPGISKDTCLFSPEIKGKDILLIDDLYTHSVCIDEDMIQALYDNGATSVCFYSIGIKAHIGFTENEEQITYNDIL